MNESLNPWLILKKLAMWAKQWQICTANICKAIANSGISLHTYYKILHLNLPPCVPVLPAGPGATLALTASIQCKWGPGPQVK